MHIIFTSINAADPLGYCERKWAASASSPGINGYEQALDAVHGIKSGSAGLPLAGAPLVPKYSRGHLKIASRMLDQAMPLIDGEKLVKDDRLDYLALDSRGFPAGTAVIVRTTNFSEHCAFIPCVTVEDGVIIRGQCDAADEKSLKSLPGAILLKDYHGPKLPAPMASAADPITAASVAWWMVSTLGTAALSKIGSLAFDYALKHFGVNDFLGLADQSYVQLVDALKLQSRENFRRDIRARAGAFTRLQSDYNAGARDLPKLQQLYTEIRQLTAWLEQDYAEVDRVHILAWAQAQYLAIMQEQAEYYRNRDPEKLKSFYKALCERALKESIVLRGIKEQAIANRLSMVKGLFTSGPWIADYKAVWYEDVIETRERRRSVFQVECTEWRSNPWPVCLNYKPTPGGQQQLDWMTGNMNRHKAWVRSMAEAALKGVEETIAAMEKLSRMEIPPPAPK